MRNMFGTVMLVLASMLVATSAQADAIDGNWCHSSHGNLEIRGENIITPGGAQMTGTYTRHTFRYVSPEGERAANQTINMAIVDDETLHLLVEDTGNGIEVWQRCRVNVSQAGGSTSAMTTR